MIPSHLLTEIYLKLPYEEIVRHCAVCQRFNSVLNDPVFWKKLVLRDFGVSIASICNNPGWRKYYEICDGIEPSSVKNIRWWDEKNKWNVRRYNIIRFFMKAIEKSNFRRVELYFRYGCNDVVQDAEYRKLLKWSYSEKRPTDAFERWFWFLTRRIKFDDITMWQDVAQDLLEEIIKNDCRVSHHPNIFDVAELIRMSGKLPSGFIYATLGQSKDINYYLLFTQEFPEILECEVTCEDLNCGKLKMDCYFFLEIGRSNNIALFDQYLEILRLQEKQNVNIRELMHIVTGCVEHDHLEFIEYMSKVQSQVFTPERLLWCCGTVPYCPTRIIDFALYMSLIAGKSEKFIRSEVDDLMNMVLKFYCGRELDTTKKRMLESNVALLIGWGYDDYEKISQVTEGKIHYIGNS